jgi:hypothetical protein
MGGPPLLRSLPFPSPIQIHNRSFAKGYPMPNFHNARGTTASRWWARCPVRPHLHTPNPRPLHTIARYRQIESRPGSRQQSPVMTAPISYLARSVGHDASHQAKRKETHLTHWPAADFLGVSRIRSGCAMRAHCRCRAIPGQTANARRMRGANEP